MTEDYYATLGVAPRSDAAEIRAAYLALMRRYHPDKNDSPEAVERAHAVIAAFAVLGDVEKRLHYDWGRRRAAEAAAQASRSRIGPMPRALGVAAVVALLLVPLFLIQYPVTVDVVPVPPTVKVAAVADDPIELPGGVAVDTPLVMTPTTVPPTPAPPTAPQPASQPAPSRTVIDRPAAAEPAAARPRAEKVKAPLVLASVPRKLLPSKRPRVPSAVKAPAPPASANPKCQAVRPGAEAAICNNEQLAALDRNVVHFYNQSLQFGAATNRGALLDSRNNFLARREACQSDACLQSVHLGHLRELSTIVEKRPPAPPR